MVGDVCGVIRDKRRGMELSRGLLTVISNRKRGTEDIAQWHSPA